MTMTSYLVVLSRLIITEMKSLQLLTNTIRKILNEFFVIFMLMEIYGMRQHSIICSKEYSGDILMVSVSQEST